MAVEWPEWKNVIFSKGLGPLHVLYTATKAALIALDERIEDVEAGTVAEGSISETELANGAVTESKLATGAVTSGKLGNGSVATAKLADASVNNAKLSFKTVEVTVNTGSLSGSSAADATIVGGTLMGLLPGGNQDQFIDNCVLNADGSITVTLAANATANNIFHFQVLKA